MDFTVRDLAIMLASTIAILAMSFTMPALGMTGDNVNSSDIPEFNITKGAFDFADKTRDDPDNLPSAPSTGTLRYVDNQVVDQDNRRIWIACGAKPCTHNGTELTLTNDGNLSDPQAQLALNTYFSTGLDNEFSLINESEYKELNNSYYKVSFENVRYQNVNESDLTILVDYEVLERPENTEKWFSSIPLVGGIIGLADQLAGVLAWGISILWHVAYNFIVASTNLFIIGFNVISFFINFVHWITSTYAAIISGANSGFATAYLTIPGVIFSFEFSKLVMIVIKLLPTT